MAHQWRRKDKKPKKIAKRVVKRGVKHDNFGFTTQIEVFKHVYFKADKPVKCLISGWDITDCMDGSIEHWVQFFAHILPKGKFLYWKFNPRNIIMLHPAAHQIVDQGTQENRDLYPKWNWEAWDNEVELAKHEYNKYVKENNL